MSKHINAGDTLTVGDLTDDHLGAVIEVGPVEGFTTRLELKALSDYAPNRYLWSTENDCKGFRTHVPVTVITPPPVVQPDEPTELGQCIWIEESRELLGFVGDPGDLLPIRAMDGRWMDWGEVLRRVGDRRIIVSDPPRWPDDTPEVPEYIEMGEWPADDRHLRGWVWIDQQGDQWHWRDDGSGESGWAWRPNGPCHPKPFLSALIRGERVE